jgi:uncharacterized protein YdaT
MTFTPQRQRKNPQARAAALAWAKNVTQDEIDKFVNTNIPNEDPSGSFDLQKCFENSRVMCLDRSN